MRSLIASLGQERVVLKQGCPIQLRLQNFRVWRFVQISVYTSRRRFSRGLAKAVEKWLTLVQVIQLRTMVKDV